MIGYPIDSHVSFEQDGTPVYDRAISAAPFRKLFKSLFSDGVLPNPSTNLQVAAGNGLNVIVQPGFAMCNGCLKLEELQRTLAVQASDITYDRIDTVVMRLDDNDSKRICDLYVVQGVPSFNPVRPALKRDGSVWELGLADLYIVKNSTDLSNQRITDTRYESARCGVISSISQFDTTTLYNQIVADLAGFKENEQAEFLQWFELIKGQLSEDAAGNLQVQIDALKTADTKDNTVSFESGDELAPSAFSDVELIRSGEKHSSFWRKTSLMFKNVRRLISLIGTTDISGIGNGTVTGAISEQYKKTNNNIVEKIGTYKSLLKVLGDMELNSVLEFSTWYPMSEFPSSIQSFWTIKIYKGAEVGFNYFLATAHTGDNSSSNIWFGTYGASSGDIVWKEL